MYVVVVVAVVVNVALLSLTYCDQNLPQLCDIARALQHDLAAVGAEISGVTRVFLKHLASFKFYGRYISEQDTALRVVALCRKNTTAFDAFLKAALANPRCRSLPLGAFLVKPMQRVTKYPLLFKVRLFSSGKLGIHPFDRSGATQGDSTFPPDLR